MPWDNPFVFAVCGGGGVHMPVCVCYETLTNAALRTVAHQTGLCASPWLAYMPQGCYTAGILIQSPAASCDSDMLARTGENSSGDCWHSMRLECQADGQNSPICEGEGQNPPICERSEFTKITKVAVSGLDSQS